MSAIEYSVVIPVFNSKDSLEELSSSLVKTFEKISNDYEIIFIDDCSADLSWEVLKSLRKSEDRIKIIRLSKNAGQHNAILCGLNHARGERIIIMDDDLQTSPEEIPKLISTMNAGYDVVFGRFAEKHHGPGKIVAGKIYHFLLHRLLGVPDSIFFSNFVIISSPVKRNILTIKSSYSFLIALIAKATPQNKIANVDIIHKERKFGRSNYTLYRHARLFSNLIINYSSIPLQAIALIGGLTSILSIMYTAYLVISKISNPAFGLEGWNSLMVATSLLGGLILLSLAIIGEYIRRILFEITFSQPYVIGEIDL